MQTRQKYQKSLFSFFVIIILKRSIKVSQEKWNNSCYGEWFPVGTREKAEDKCNGNFAVDLREMTTKSNAFYFFPLFFLHIMIVQTCVQRCSSGWLVKGFRNVEQSWWEMFLSFCVIIFFVASFRYFCCVKSVLLPSFKEMLSVTPGGVAEIFVAEEKRLQKR